MASSSKGWKSSGGNGGGEGGDGKKRKKDKKRAKPESEDENTVKIKDEDGIEVLMMRSLPGDDLGLVVTDDGTEEWVVNKIVNKTTVKGVLHYKVNWYPWSTRYDTWEPITNLKNSKEAIRDFEKELKEIGPQPEKPPQDLSFLAEIKKELPPDENGGEQGDLPSSGFALCDPDGDEYDDPEVKQLLAIYRQQFGPSFPLYRHHWYPWEIPYCIIGSRRYRDFLLHAVRLRTPQDPEYIEDPVGTATDHNIVMIKSEELGKVHPQILISYYQKNFMLSEHGKSQAELDKCAARAGIYNAFKKGKVEVNYAKISNHMLPKKHRFSDKAIRQAGTYLKVNRLVKKREKKEKLKMKIEVDQFGLPLKFEDNLDANDEGKSDSDSEDSDEDWEKVDIEALPSSTSKK